MLNSTVCAKCSVCLLLDHDSLMSSLGSSFNLEQKICEGTESDYGNTIINRRCKTLKSNEYYIGLFRNHTAQCLYFSFAACFSWGYRNRGFTFNEQPLTKICLCFKSIHNSS